MRSCHKVRLRVSREVLAPEERHKGRAHCSLTSRFFSYYLRTRSPKYVTIGPDQSLLISIGILALTLIGCESNQAHPQVEHMGLLHSLFLFIFCIFFFWFVFIYFIHYSQFVMAERQFISLTQRKQRKKYSICVVIIMKTKAYWAQCISFSLYYRILISIIDS